MFQLFTRVGCRRCFLHCFHYGISPLIYTVLLVCFSLNFSLRSVFAESKGKPNIVLIMADDMGFGDVHALNPASKIATPHLDKLASESLTFLDAHTPSAVCTPTRYGLMTGRYCWRTSLKRGVLGGYSPPLISPDRVTIARMLKQAGYHTAAIGKWHLGMGLPMKPESKKSTSEWEGDPGVDFSQPIANGPTTRGSTNFSACVLRSTCRLTCSLRTTILPRLPTLQQSKMSFPAFVRAGPRAEDFVLADVLDHLTARAVGHIGRAEIR